MALKSMRTSLLEQTSSMQRGRLLKRQWIPLALLVLLFGWATYAYATNDLSITQEPHFPSPEQRQVQILD